MENAVNTRLDNSYVQIDVLPTQFSESTQPTTLATPSCCCCCCCCLVTISTVTTLVAVDGNYTARENGRSGWVAPVAALALWPLLIYARDASSSVANKFFPNSQYLAAFFVVLLALLWGFLIRGAVGDSPKKALAFGPPVMALGAVAMLAEFIVVIFTLGLVELAIPLGIWAALRIARSRHPRFQVPQKTTWTPNFSLPEHATQSPIPSTGAAKDDPGHL